MAMVALSKKSTVSAGAQVGSCIDRRERFGFRFSGAATLASSRPLGTAPVPAGLVGKVKRGEEAVYYIINVCELVVRWGLA